MLHELPRMPPPAPPHSPRKSLLPCPACLLAQEVSQRCGGARVDLLTHSLGGLVVRSLLSDYPAEYGALVRPLRFEGGEMRGRPGWHEAGRPLSRARALGSAAQQGG